MLYGELLCIEAEQNKIFSAGKCGCTISFGRRQQLILTCSGRKSLPDDCSSAVMLLLGFDKPK